MRLQAGRRAWVFVVSHLALAALVCGAACAVRAPEAEGEAFAAAPEESAPAKAAPDKAAVKPPARSYPMFGGTNQRNLVNLVEKGILVDWSVKKGKEKNVKWAARLGDHAYGGPVIAGGRVFVGTNNQRPRDPAVKGDKGVVMCFRLSDGEFLWQALHDKLPDKTLNDCAQQGVASTPVVEGERLWYVSNRCEVVCADVKGDPANKGKAKFLWKYDMIAKEGVFPCQLANCSPLIVGDLVYVVTGNGTNIDTNKLPAPKAPSFLALDKNTGKVAWRSSLPSPEVIRGQWGNPAAAEVGGKTQVIFPGGDGWLYGLDAKTGELIWKFDCNPKKAKAYQPGGAGEQCFIVATPVVHDNKVYVGVGQEPDDGPGVGHLWCVDITKKPVNKDKDLSPVGNNFDPKAPANKDSGLVWHYGGPVVPAPKGDDRDIVFGRTISTVAVHDGLVYATEVAGYLHCVDARTGKRYWMHDFQSETWSSPYYVDGKVYLGTNSNEMLIYRHGKKLSKPEVLAMGGQLKVPPVALDGVLYVNASSYLYALAPGK
jgi:outer membrane protein assembly factor BamB